MQWTYNYNLDVFTHAFCRILLYFPNKITVYINNTCFLKNLPKAVKCFKKETLLIYIVHLLGKYNNIYIYIYTHTHTHTGFFDMIVRVLTTCHTQYTSDSSTCIFLFNRTTLQVFVTYLTGALYVHPLWFCKHQHENQVRSNLFVACQQWWCQWRFWFVPSVLGYLREEEHNGITPSKEITWGCIWRTRWQLLKPWQLFWITLCVYIYIFIL